MISQLLRAFGLARAGQVRALADQAESATARARELKTELDGTREDTRRWRTQIDELKERLANASRDIERWKARDAGHVEELNALKEELNALKGKFERLKAAEQTTAVAREHLLAIETKLDIVEGAIDVLDRRTRAVLAARSESPPGGGGRS